MGKLLRVLVIFLLLVSIAALVLAHMLFNRREVLRGRVETLQSGINRVARTLETTSPESPAVPPNFPERDIAPITAEPEPSPRRGQFWRNYQVHLEEVDRPLMDLSNRRQELLTLYRVNSAGMRIAEGPGTMHGVLEELLTRAGAQYNTLTATRQQLRMLREELVGLIGDYNNLRNDLRTEKATVVRVSAERDEHRQAAEDTRRELAQEQQRGRELELRIGDLEQEEIILREQIETLQIRNEEQVAMIGTLRAEITRLETLGARGIGDAGDVMTGTARIDMEIGEKGTIVSADHDFMFVVIELTDEAIEELIEASVDGRLPLVDFYIERSVDGRRQFISKIRLTQLNRQRSLGIGEIMPDWHQESIRPGDSVVYQ